MWRQRCCCLHMFPYTPFMCTQYFIRLTLKTDQGMECIGNFNIGNDKETAATLFRQLKGNADVSEKDVLFLEFMEMANGLPYSLQLITCTLKELGENCKLITKELFKSLLLSSRLTGFSPTSL